ncbi:hypothetical protein J6590_031307 [Homalodisca vitripennis]|nr:hypothetical protein J6590_031307 [Homalodisca vitripennis]
MSHMKCFRDAAHNATPPRLPPITTHSRDVLLISPEVRDGTTEAHTDGKGHVCLVFFRPQIMPQYVQLQRHQIM